MSNKNLYDFLNDNLPFFKFLKEQDKTLLMNNTQTLNVKSLSNLSSGGDTNCVGIILVKSGQLRTYMLSNDAKEVTLYRLFDGDTCILSASCILKNITFQVYIDAEKDSEVLFIKSHIYEKLSKCYLEVENFSKELMASRFSDAMWVMEQIVFMSFDKRLALFLLDQAGIDGSDTIKLTHDTIAKHIGSAREVVSRMLKYFQNEGIVALSRGDVTITDRKKLIALTK